MWLILLEALLALVVLLGIVWWTMFSGRRRGERDERSDGRPDGRADGRTDDRSRR